MIFECSACQEIEINETVSPLHHIEPVSIKLLLFVSFYSSSQSSVNRWENLLDYFRSIIKRATALEYKLHRLIVKKEDFISYVQVESLRSHTQARSDIFKN